MNFKILIVSLLLASSLLSSGQTADRWENWRFLIGTWVGEGNGQPGQGSGSFTFAFELDKNILVRKNHTEFPASNGRPAFAHDDLMIMYNGGNGIPLKAIYFDNENHVIHYTVAFSEKSIILTSEKMGDGPVFRLTYIPLDNHSINVKFEISNDGLNFSTYLEGKSTRSE